MIAVFATPSVKLNPYKKRSPANSHCEFTPASRSCNSSSQCYIPQCQICCSNHLRYALFWFFLNYVPLLTSRVIEKCADTRCNKADMPTERWVAADWRFWLSAPTLSVRQILTPHLTKVTSFFLFLFNTVPLYSRCLRCRWAIMHSLKHECKKVCMFHCVYDTVILFNQALKQYSTRAHFKVLTLNTSA